MVMPGQPIKRRLSPEQTQQMITFACRKPWENAESIVGDGRAVLGLNQVSNAISVSHSILWLLHQSLTMSRPSLDFKSVRACSLLPPVSCPPQPSSTKTCNRRTLWSSLAGAVGTWRISSSTLAATWARGPTSGSDPIAAVTNSERQMSEIPS